MKHRCTDNAWPQHEGNGRTKARRVDVPPFLRLSVLRPGPDSAAMRPDPTGSPGGARSPLTAHRLPFPHARPPPLPPSLRLLLARLLRGGEAGLPGVVLSAD